MSLTATPHLKERRHLHFEELSFLGPPSNKVNYWNFILDTISILEAIWSPSSDTQDDFLLLGLQSLKTLTSSLVLTILIIIAGLRGAKNFNNNWKSFPLFLLGSEDRQARRRKPWNWPFHSNNFFYSFEDLLEKSTIITTEVLGDRNLDRRIPQSKNPQATHH